MQNCRAKLHSVCPLVISYLVQDTKFKQEINEFSCVYGSAK